MIYRYSKKHYHALICWYFHLCWYSPKKDVLHTYSCWYWYTPEDERGTYKSPVSKGKWSSKPPGNYDVPAVNLQGCIDTCSPFFLFFTQFATIFFCNIVRCPMPRELLERQTTSHDEASYFVDVKTLLFWSNRMSRGKTYQEVVVKCGLKWNILNWSGLEHLKYIEVNDLRGLALRRNSLWYMQELLLRFPGKDLTNVVFLGGTNFQLFI